MKTCIINQFVALRLGYQLFLARRIAVAPRQVEADRKSGHESLDAQSPTRPTVCSLTESPGARVYLVKLVTLQSFSRTA
ncbi:MAG: hypothetical protein R3C02_23120 [Planctomycetaceae bacterium]